MAYLTPSPTGQKLGLFSGSPPRWSRLRGSRQRLVYYEDVYGQINDEEEREGSAQQCESDSDREDERIAAVAGRSSDSKSSHGSGMVSDPESSDDYDNKVDATEYMILPRANGRRSVPARRASKAKKSIKHDGGGLDDNAPVDSGAVQDKHIDESASDDDENHEEKVARVVRAPRARRGRKKSQRGAASPRPEARRLLKQQLADRDKEKKLAQRAAPRKKTGQREASRLAKIRAAGIKNAVPKGRSGINKGGLKGSKTSEASKGMGIMVVIDNSDIDMGEYQCIAD